MYYGCFYFKNLRFILKIFRWVYIFVIPLQNIWLQQSAFFVVGWVEMYVCGEEEEGVMPHYVCAIFSFCNLMGCLHYWAPASILTYTSPPLYFYKKALLLILSGFGQTWKFKYLSRAVSTTICFLKTGGHPKREARK